MHDEQLLRRVALLERKCRWQSSALGAICLVGICTLLVGFQQAATPDPPLRTTRLTLVDGNGRERAILGADGDRAGLRIAAGFGDKKGDLVFIGSEKVDGPGDYEMGTVRVRSTLLTEHETGATTLQFYARNSKTERRVSLGTTPRGDPEVEMSDKSGFGFIRLGYSEKLGSTFQIRAPLGIAGAWEEMAKEDARAAQENRKPKYDERIADLYDRSLRFLLTVPPFDTPGMTLERDGQRVWSAP